MTEHATAKGSNWFGRRRQARSAKRQERLERQFFEGEREGPDSIYSTSSAYPHSGPVVGWMGFGGFGGDGGGCGGDGGGC